jgi:hypothetical protein
MLNPRTKTKGAIALKGFKGDMTGMEQIMAVIKK